VHVEHHIAAFVRQLQADQALLRLTTCLADLGRLKPVVNGVAQHVLQRRHHTLKNVAVDFGFSIDHVEFNVLAQFARHLTHHAFKPR